MVGRKRWNTPSKGKMTFNMGTFAAVMAPTNRALQLRRELHLFGTPSLLMRRVDKCCFKGSKTLRDDSIHSEHCAG